MTIQLDMYQTIAVAVVVLMLGNFLNHRIAILERFCIPAPVIGGSKRSLYGILLYICWISGKLKSLKKWWKIFDHFPDPCDHVDHMPELSCSRSVQSTTDQSFGWTLYRFYPYDRWSWYRWCIWTCS